MTDILSSLCIHTYTKKEKSLDMIMFTCIKEHLRNF